MKEIIDVIGPDPKQSKTTITQLNQLSYLELVIKESLRLYPSVPIVGRFATEDVHLSKLFEMEFNDSNLTVCDFAFVFQQKVEWSPKDQTFILPFAP